MNKGKLIAYDEKGDPLFIRFVKDKEEAQKTVLNHGYLARVAWIIYRQHKYTISDVYNGLNHK